MGFNYIFNGNIDEQHAKFPNQPSMGTEETTSRSTRGIYFDDSINAHMMPIDHKNPDRGIEKGLTFYEARPFLSGIFYWTGFDYRGEPNPYGWPQVGSQSGILDQCGFPKDMFYYLKSWWTTAPVLHIFPHWNWKGKEGQNINIWVYSNCDEVELYLNNKSLGRKSLTVNSHLEWIVKYEPGILMANGYKNGKKIITDKVETTSTETTITLTPDKSNIKADGEDVSVVTMNVNDVKGKLVPTASNEITFTIKGPGKIIGVGNGDPSSHEPDRYFEDVARIKIEILKKLEVENTLNRPEVSPDLDVSKWLDAFSHEGFENRVKQDSSKAVVLRGEFQLPELTDDKEITLLAKSLCQVQAIYVNGQLIAENIKRDDPGQNYILDHKILQSGKNIYVVVGTPLVKTNQWEYLNTDPGLIQVITPADHWKRRLFSGFAQIIIQSQQVPGDITLVASSPGLIPAEIKIICDPTIVRSAVP
jgi:beta-galactosidase